MKWALGGWVLLRGMQQSAGVEFPNGKGGGSFEKAREKSLPLF
jgi:hypothetical protein